MARYLDILAMQEPFPFNLDGQGRVMFSFNIRAEVAGSTGSLEEEMARLLVDAGVGVLNQTIFGGILKDWPTGDGPYINLIAQLGPAPAETHNGDEYRRLAMQVVVVGKSFSSTRSKALAARAALNGVRNQTVVP